MTQRGITRSSSATQSYVAAATAADSVTIPFGASAGGVIVVDAVSGAASISWYTKLGFEDTAVPVYSDGSIVSTDVSAGRAYSLPDSLFACQYLVPVANSGTVTFRLSIKG